MGHLRVGAAVRRLQVQPRALSRGASGRSTPAAFLKSFGRAVLWLLVAVLLIRGLADVLARSAPAAAVRSAPVAPVAWPDDEARAFAVEFARVYLGTSPKAPDRYASAVRRFVAPDVADVVVPEVAKGAPAVTVGAVTVARSARIDADHALVTVAADAGGSTRYLTVPVARDGAGGLVVYGLPSFAAAPPRAQVEPASADPLSGPDAGAIEDVVTRFLKAFLAGDAQQLAYFVPSGVRMGALAQPVEMVGPVSVTETAPAEGRWRDVLATVSARDSASGAVYPLAYKVRLVREDRWLVASVNDATPRGG
jgi:hypothetical protein